jgi:cytosine/adenosine deaminase-related metal-dependent hydrolase
VTAGLLWPGKGSAIRQGALLVAPGGRVEAVGPERLVPRPPAAEQVSFPDCVVLPGLVNTHTHLELTDLRGRVRDTDFFAWLQHVRQEKEALTEEAFVAAACRGLEETWRCGITCIADTGTSGATAVALTRLGGRGVVYQEAIAPRAEQASTALERLRREVDRLRGLATDRVLVGVSPHAPYTVSRELYRLVAAYARAEDLPVAAHIAESPAEVEFVRFGRGPFAQSWRARGIAPGATASSPVALLDEVGLLNTRLLAIHAVHTDEADLERLRRSGVGLACCPRSNARHGHGEPPLARYLQAGLRLGLGTDSVASVADLDLLAEAGLARRLTGMDPEGVLDLLTRGGAAALGLEAEIGRLAPGKAADLCVVAVGGAALDSKDSWAEAVLALGAAGVVATYVAGRCVYRVERST